MTFGTRDLRLIEDALAQYDPNSEKDGEIAEQIRFRVQRAINEADAHEATTAKVERP